MTTNELFRNLVDNLTLTVCLVGLLCIIVYFIAKYILYSQRECKPIYSTAFSAVSNISLAIFAAIFFAVLTGTLWNEKYTKKIITDTTLQGIDTYFEEITNDKIKRYYLDAFIPQNERVRKGDDYSAFVDFICKQAIDVISQYQYIETRRISIEFKNHKENNINSTEVEIIDAQEIHKLDPDKPFVIFSADSRSQESGGLKFIKNDIVLQCKNVTLEKDKDYKVIEKHPEHLPQGITHLYEIEFQNLDYLKESEIDISFIKIFRDNDFWNATSIAIPWAIKKLEVNIDWEQNFVVIEKFPSIMDDHDIIRNDDKGQLKITAHDWRFPGTSIFACAIRKPESSGQQDN